MTRALALTCLLAATPAVAQPARPATARVVAIAPLSTLGSEDTSASTKKLTQQLEAAFASLPGTKVVTAAQVADAIKRSKKNQLRVCERDPACLADLGKLVGASIVVDGEVGGLGDTRVVYLGATDVATAKELRSTTLSIGGKADAAGGAPGAAVRLLDPDRYRGQLKLAIDVRGATVYVNGSKVALAANSAVTLPVGTQAVRVTHPEYRDFVRFIDVPYGQTLEVPVGMQAYPTVQHDIQGKPTNTDRIDYIDPPWYRRWYVIAGGAVAVTVLSAIIVGNLVDDLDYDDCRKVGGSDC